MSVRKRVYGVLAVAVVLTGGWYAYQFFWGDPGGVRGVSASQSVEPDGGGEVLPVELAAARFGPISSYVTSTANLRALREVFVAARADGVVREILVEEGDWVEKDQPLCLLDDSELRLRLSVNQTRLEQARVQLKKARIQGRKASVQVKNSRVELVRQEDAYAERLISEEEVATARYRLEELEHDQQIADSEVTELGHRVEELKGEIEQVQLEITRTSVNAPFTGTITQRMIELGQTVRNMDRIFLLAHFSSLHAEVYLSELATRRIRSGQKAVARLESEDLGSIEGRVLRVSPVVDSATGTVKVTVELQPGIRKDVFRPGAFVIVSIETDSKNRAILIPKRALLEQDGETSVFVVGGETATKRNVTLGYDAEREVEVTSGVSEGEEVVIAGQGNLEDGAKVRVAGS